MHSRTPQTATRRAALASIFALSTAAGAGAAVGIGRALAAAPHDDAAMLALEPEFLRRVEALDAAHDAVARLEDMVAARIGRRPVEMTSAAVTAWIASAETVRAELGAPAADAAIDAAWGRAHDLVEAILAIRPRTLDGLCLHVRVLRRFEMEPPAQLLDDVLAVRGATTAWA